jgi:arsenate reductase
MPGVAVTVHHSFDDPPAEAKSLADNEALDVYRRVRDEIKSFVVALPAYFTPIAESA